uniref:ARS-binding protein 1 N-terminal domain-containing protein n=1 Tax=Phytophthora ramorum TaxID=164328 RepID=H3GUG1_PHYRM
MGGWMKIKEKRALIKKAADCPAMAQNELAAWAKSTFKLKRDPAQTTVSDILKRATAIMSADYGDGNRRNDVAGSGGRAVGMDTEAGGVGHMPFSSANHYEGTCHTTRAMRRLGPLIFRRVAHGF